MNEQQQEAEIQAKSLNAPRLTPSAIDSVIASEHYFTARDGVVGVELDIGLIDEAGETNTPDALRLLTFCVLVLENGFTVTGESACASLKTSMQRSGERSPMRMRGRKSGRLKAIC